MQVYQGLDNITNKHPIEERENIPHHLLGHVSWAEEYSVQQFEKEALQVIDDIHSRGKLPILVGGTHYYNQAVIFKNATLSLTENGQPPESDNENDGNDDDGFKNLKQKDSKFTQEQLDILNGPTSIILQQLKIHDPIIAQKFHPNDTRRIQRALEVFYETGQKPSSIYFDQKKIHRKRRQTSSVPSSNNNSDEEGSNTIDASEENDDYDTSLDSRYRTCVFWIWSDQTALNKRLDDRVDVMLNNGLYSEIDEMYAKYTQELKEIRENKDNEESQDLTKGVWQVIGFRQFLPWLETNKQDVKKLELSIDEMKRNTRRYSKQQTKFMKNNLMPKINMVIEKNNQHHQSKDNNNNNEDENSLVATILDASDLSKWSTEVGQKGISIAKRFIDGELNNLILLDGDDITKSNNNNKKNESNDLENISISNSNNGNSNHENDDIKTNNNTTKKHLNKPKQQPKEFSLRDLLITPKKFDETQWQTFTCKTCGTLNKENGEIEPYVAVGKDNWDLHIRSKKHKRTLSQIAKHERNLREIAKRKKNDDNDNNNNGQEGSI